MAEPTPHVPKPGRTDRVGVSTEDRSPEEYESARDQAARAVESARTKVAKADQEVLNAHDALTEAEAALAALPEE